MSKFDEVMQRAKMVDITDAGHNALNKAHNSDMQELVDTMNTKQFNALLKWQDERELLNKRIAELELQVSRSSRIISEIRDVFYEQNLAVSGWHLNGNLEPMDDFFDLNDWSEVEK
jgi:hypothetical protein